MSKEFDQNLLDALKELCGNDYFSPTEFDITALEQTTNKNSLEISHALNNLQRNGLIRITMGLPGELSKVELLKQA
ncbi:MAG TPA: hypothetical protein VEC37_14575 [Bacillota bacterium]|nr:hypothetical protein [Bacillota bacterium]